MTKTSPSTEAKTIDEPRLETDVAYRFQYISEVVGLSKNDQKTLRQHRTTIEPYLIEIVDRVYLKMFQYDSMKRHFLPRHTGFEGDVPSELDDLKLDHAQTQFRKTKLNEYFVKLCTAEWDDTFAVLVDIVGNMHTRTEGNTRLDVPIVQISAVLGVMNDLFLEAISEMELSVKTQIALQRAYTKLFWVQNCMFIRHWTN